MVNDLTSLKWKKSIYYVSDGVIFDIENTRKKADYDGCGIYLVDFSKVSQSAVDAKDGTVIDISNTPDAFVENVPYLLFTFYSINGDPLERYVPLQYLIEEGDKVIDNKAFQYHPDIFANEYIHKFNNDIFDYIKSLIKNRKAFDPKNVALVMKSLPDWLTKAFSGQYMTESYIDTHFLKGKHYDDVIAKKGATSSHDLYDLRVVYLCIGKVGTDNAAFAPINFWQEEVVRKCLDAIYIQDFVNAYNNEINYFDSTQMLSVDTMENIIKYSQNIETAYNPNGVKTLLNVDYGANLVDSHDIYDIKFEDICTNAITYQDYLKHKDDKPQVELTFEEIVEQDKQFILNYITENYENPESVDKYWYESQITLNHTYDDPESDSSISAISNVFQLCESAGMLAKFTSVIIQHAGEKMAVKVVKDGIWVGDNDMWERENEIVVSWDAAYSAYMSSSFDKINSRQCVLRAKLGPNGGTIAPQYIIGNIHSHYFVDSNTAVVSDVDPLFPNVEPNPLDGTSEDIRERHMNKVKEQYPGNTQVQWCQTKASMEDFLDEATNVSNTIVEQTDIFKIIDENNNEGYVSVISDDIDNSPRIEQIENLDNELTDGIITDADLCSAYQLAHSVKFVLKIAPHSEKFAIYKKNGVTIAQFGFDNQKVLVNAKTMELIQGPTQGFTVLNAGH